MNVTIGWMKSVLAVLYVHWGHKAKISFGYTSNTHDQILQNKPKMVYSRDLSVMDYHG